MSLGSYQGSNLLTRDLSGHIVEFTMYFPIPSQILNMSPMTCSHSYLYNMPNQVNNWRITNVVGVILVLIDTINFG